MPKICVNSPEVAMHGEINIHAQVAIVTKAKLDAISVGGECHCGEAEPVITDYVVVIDGSDSYNNKVTMSSGQTVESEAFDQTKRWCAGLFKNLSNANNANLTTVSLVQFSGIKPLEGSYKPGAQGETGNAGLYHYRVQVAPTAVGNLRNIDSSCTGFDALDGNGQLFLCLQDLAMPWFTEQFQRALPGAKRETVIIVVSDEEWDVKKLQNAFGSGNATADSVCEVSNPSIVSYFIPIVSDINIISRLSTKHTLNCSLLSSDQTDSTIKTRTLSRNNFAMARMLTTSRYVFQLSSFKLLIFTISDQMPYSWEVCRHILLSHTYTLSPNHGHKTHF